MAFTAGDESDLEGMYYDLQDTQTVGLMLTQVPCLVESGGIFTILLEIGMPLAVWGRCNFEHSSNEALLTNVLRECQLEQLPQAVRQCRQQSRRHSSTNHIGHHLSLLWDDPDLIPPKSA
jgi:hypothetical protein